MTSQFDLNRYLTIEDAAYVDPPGEGADRATLAQCFRDLLAASEDAGRDRRLLLHLAFLAWYGLVEPPFITGFGRDEDAVIAEEVKNVLQRRFEECITALDSSYPADAEYLYVAWLMTHLFPAVLGDAEHWFSKSRQFRDRYDALAARMHPSCFDNQGGYGRYFKKQLDTFKAA